MNIITIRDARNDTHHDIQNDVHDSWQFESWYEKYPSWYDAIHADSQHPYAPCTLTFANTITVIRYR